VNNAAQPSSQTTLIRDRFATAMTGRMRGRSPAPRFPQRFTEQTRQFLCCFKAAPRMRRHLYEAVGQFRVMHVSDFIACRRKLLCVSMTDITQHIKAASDKDRLGKRDMAGCVQGVMYGCE
jgi:hypothetical protein